MKIAIRYYSKSGNTEKLAKTIEKAISVKAETVDIPLNEKVDILFLGSSVYAAGVDEAVKNFIKDNKNKIGTIVNFSTAAIIPSTYKQIKKIANENGIKISEEEFHCRGSFAMMHKNRPNEDDCKEITKFVKNIVL